MSVLIFAFCPGRRVEGVGRWAIQIRPRCYGERELLVINAKCFCQKLTNTKEFHKGSSVVGYVL